MQALGIDPKLLIAQLINFALFAYLFKKFLWVPYQKFLSEEKNKLNKMQNIEKDYQSKLEEAQSEASKIVSRAHDQSTEIIQEAKVASQQLQEQANKKLEQDLSRERDEFLRNQEKDLVAVKSQLSAHTLDLAKNLAKKALSESLSSSDQNQIIKNVIAKLEQKSL